MNPKAVTRSKQEKEIATYELMHKTMEGTLVITNGAVDRISLSIEALDTFGNKPKRVSVLDLQLANAKSLYLVLRSMLKITGDLDELDACVL